MAGSLEEALGVHYKFIIDNDLRTISIPDDMVFGVYNDRNVQTIDFEMPRYYHGDLDLSEFSIRINYITGGHGNIYLVLDKVATANKITFTWTVDIGAYLQNGGSVTFAVCLRKVDQDSQVTHEFNTTIHTVKVLEGLEVSPASQHQVLDYLTQIQQIIENLEDSAEQMAEDIAEEVRKSIPQDYSALSDEVSDLNDDFVTSIGEIREATINVFTGKDMISGLSNMQYLDYIASNTQADTTTSKSLYVRLRDNDNVDSGVLGVNAMVNGETYSATFTKSSNSKSLWFHAGGNSKNLRVFLNVSNLPNGTYTVSFKIISNDVNTIGGFRIGNIQIESGSTAHAYTYPYTAKDDVARNDIDALEVDVYNMVKPSKNINGNWELGGIEYSTGAPYQSTSNVRSKYIPVEKGKTYAFDIAERTRAYSCYAFFYDETGAYISGSRITTQYGFFPKIITVPDNDSIKYIRLNMQTADVDISNGQAEENIMSTTYRDPAQPTFNKMELPNSAINYMGKKVVVFGDSITAMGDDSSTASKGWTSWFKASVKPSDYHTYAVGGSSVCDYVSGDFLSEQIDAFIEDAINDIDCFIISSGTNDLNHTIPTDSEIEAQFYDSNMDAIPLSNVDKTTWAGALRYAVETLRNNSKKAKIFICTPVNRTYDSNEPVRSLYGTINDKCEIIKKMCYRLGVECIDTHECGVYGSAYYLTDKLHPTEIGARMISEYIISRYMQWFNIE